MTNNVESNIDNQQEHQEQNVDILVNISERQNIEDKVKNNQGNNIENNQNTEEPIYINESHGYKGKIFSMKLAILSMIVNIFLPGIGTMIGTCGMNEDILINEYMCKGCCQLVSTICIVGWFYAQYTSYYYIRAACFKRPFESYRTKTIVERQMRKSFNNQNS